MRVQLFVARTRKSHRKTFVPKCETLTLERNVTTHEFLDKLTGSEFAVAHVDSESVNDDSELP